MTDEDDPEAYLNSFECTASVARWLEIQWVTIIIPCLVGPVQQAMDTLLMSDYKMARDAILQNLNLIPEAYQQSSQEMEFSQDYHPRLTGQKMRAVNMRWLELAVRSAEQIIKAVRVEHYRPSCLSNLRTIYLSIT